jgi:glycosyltransferase involved in cell wall biosynthesis
VTIEVVERPLIAFIVFSYRQEKFVGESVAGAFSQTYSPLEIILSDDCSPDATYDVMKGMAESYRGPHRIVLNRNPQNLGVGGHLNHVVGLTRAELLVGSAGDDVSMPNRVERVFEAGWARVPTLGSIYSAARIIDHAGQQLPQALAYALPQHSLSAVEAARRIKVGVPGCTHAFRKELFELFGPLPLNVVNEDEVLAFRSLLVGGICHVPDPLVCYRRHEKNISGRDEGHWRLSRVREEYRRRVARDKAVFVSWLQDIRFARFRELRPEAELNEAERNVIAHLKYLDLEQQLVGMNIWRAVGECLRPSDHASREPTIRAFVRTQLPIALRKWRKRISERFGGC